MKISDNSALAYVWLILSLATAFQVDPSAFKSSRPVKTIHRRFDLLATSNSNDSNSNVGYRRRANVQQRDVVIVGGGLAGLSAALYLSQIDPSRHVTIFDREEYGKTDKKAKHAQPASFAAAGMLAPQSERLPPGHLLDLCVASRRMFPEFCDMVESLAQESGDEGAPFLHDNQFPSDKNSDMDPWSVGYVGSGGFLAPAFAGDAVATWAPPEESGAAVWLDAMQVRELEPLLHPDVVGGWWFPDDASVDARRLTCSLRAACVAAGVQILAGPQYEIASLDLIEGECKGMWLQSSKKKSGQRYVQAKSVLISNGAWMRQLLPVPIDPHKGQSLSLRMPADRPPILRRVLFAQDSYIVPKADGRIVVGATVEAGSYDPNVTPAGIMHIMTHAMQLVPALKDLPIEETWVGLRPTTPDKGPVLGETPWKNLFVAGGYWRNGVLLAPKTGQLLASLIAKSSNGDFELNTEDANFLKAFAWDRFTSKSGGKALAASARYAASMYPVHRRSSTGVSAAVGTELGSYSSARAAKEDREKDRRALWSNGSEDDLFERAAAMGREDASVYSFGDNKTKEETSSVRDSSPVFYEGSPDAFTVGSASSDEEPSVDDLVSTEATEIENSVLIGDEKNSDMESVYKSIKENKSKNSKQIESNVGQTEERPDLGFRIHHIDSETGEVREVPPYTSPGDFLDMVEQEKSTASGSAVTNDDENSMNQIEAPNDLASAYKRIQANLSKRGDAASLLKNNIETDERPDPGFRIYHIDPSTGEEREVPPYTSPGDFLASIGVDEKRQDEGAASKREPENSENKNSSKESTTYTEQTYDGYQDIMQANSRSSREEELEAMRAARRQNRLGQEEIDMSKIGAQRMDGDFPTSIRTEEEHVKEEKEQTVGKEPMREPKLAENINLSNESTTYNEQTYDGYQDIMQTNSRSSREEELEAMRAARRQNRLGQEEIDMSKIGAQRMDDDELLNGM